MTRCILPGGWEVCKGLGEEGLGGCMSTESHTHADCRTCALRLQVRHGVNAAFYGLPLTPEQLLLQPGAVPPPPAASCLYEALSLVETR